MRGGFGPTDHKTTPRPRCTSVPSTSRLDMDRSCDGGGVVEGRDERVETKGVLTDASPRRKEGTGKVGPGRGV